MATTPFVVDRFGGLDVYNDPQEVGAASAVDMLNVDLDQRGRLRARDGSSIVYNTAGTNPYSALGYYTTGLGFDEFIIGMDGNTARPISVVSATAGTTATLDATGMSNNSFARYGDPSTKYLYVASATGPSADHQFVRFNGSSWTTITLPTPDATGMYPRFAAVTPNDNRLVLAGIGDPATSADSSAVIFSNPGAPEAFTSGNYVSLWPGDGERFAGIVTWRDSVFAFKKTKFAVFTGTGVSSTGSPIFNYRGVTAGRGAHGPGMVAAGEEGVYFADASGVYLTTGGEPRYISRAIEPWLKAGSYGALPAFTLSSAQLIYHDRRLYVTFPNGASAATLVYDPALDAWMVWKAQINAAAPVPAFSSYRGLYFGEYTTKKLWKMDSTVATDNGSAISWSYTSGAYDMGYPGQAKISLESRAWGVGAATLKVANDFGSFDAGSALALGVSPAVADAWQQIDREGTLWQHKLSGAGGASVSRLIHYLSHIKGPGIQ